MSAFGESFDNEREFALFLGLTTSELPKLGVLLEWFEPGRAIGLAQMAVLKATARFIVQQRNANPPPIPEIPKHLKRYTGGF